MLDGFEHQLMLVGHTHVQLARMIEGRLVVNPGSVGLPFRGMPFGELQLISPWAEYALIEIEKDMSAAAIWSPASCSGRVPVGPGAAVRVSD